MKRLAKTLFAAFAITVSLSSCREQKDGTPNENYEMNHRTEDAVDTSATKTDTVISNSTQTDPAATN